MAHFSDIIVNGNIAGVRAYSKNKLSITVNDDLAGKLRKANKNTLGFRVDTHPGYWKIADEYHNNKLKNTSRLVLYRVEAENTPVIDEAEDIAVIDFEPGLINPKDLHAREIAVIVNADKMSEVYPYLLSGSPIACNFMGYSGKFSIKSISSVGPAYELILKLYPDEIQSDSEGYGICQSGDNIRLEYADKNKLEELRDKIDGLEADLESAVEVAFKRGAHQWVAMNYPDMFRRLRDRLKRDLDQMNEQN
jgi:hypothetical protein